MRLLIVPFVLALLGAALPLRAAEEATFQVQATLLAVTEAGDRELGARCGMGMPPGWRITGELPHGSYAAAGAGTFPTGTAGLFPIPRHPGWVLETTQRLPLRVGGI